MLRNKLYIAALALVIGFGAMAQQSVSAFDNLEQDAVVIEIYPNPAVDYLTIEMTNSNLEDVKFELRSIIGNQLMIEPESIGVNTFRISLKEYSSGYYFLVIRDDMTRFKKAIKFLKQ